jgi:programmed cell death 6-interacting protein
MQTKQHHFEAAAQVRKAMDDSENNRYVFNGVISLISPIARFGCEVARLASARVYAKQGQDSAKRGVSNAVIEDINVLIVHLLIDSI